MKDVARCEKAGEPQEQALIPWISEWGNHPASRYLHMNP